MSKGNLGILKNWGKSCWKNLCPITGWSGQGDPKLSRMSFIGNLREIQALI